MSIRLLLAIALALPLAAHAAEPAASTTASVAPKPAPDPSAPPIRQRAGLLVDLKGRALYTYKGDKTAGRSDCDSQCSLLWPPIYAEAAARPKGPFTIVLRPDGRRQWAWHGRPLYRWKGDSKRGDAGGDGVADMWQLVRLNQDVNAVAPVAPPPVQRPLPSASP
jgi:predicted lipoprotein with Yx(FWY)xxD motif